MAIDAHDTWCKVRFLFVCVCIYLCIYCKRKMNESHRKRVSAHSTSFPTALSTLSENSWAQWQDLSLHPSSVLGQCCKKLTQATQLIRKTFDLSLVFSGNAHFRTMFKVGAALGHLSLKHINILTSASLSQSRIICDLYIPVWQLQAPHVAVH